MNHCFNIRTIILICLEMSGNPYLEPTKIPRTKSTSDKKSLSQFQERKSIYIFPGFAFGIMYLMNRIKKMLKLVMLQKLV